MTEKTNQNIVEKMVKEELLLIKMDRLAVMFNLFYQPRCLHA